MSPQRRTIRTDKPSQAGHYKLAVYFIDHQDVNGRPKTFWSHRNHDKTGISLNRLKQLVSNRWQGKVAWAALYDCRQSRFGEKIAEFKDGSWH
ncbi:MAG: hypothetical protein AAFQ37_01895 [Bacteroidota bacterium]